MENNNEPNTNPKTAPGTEPGTPAAEPKTLTIEDLQVQMNALKADNIKLKRTNDSLSSSEANMRKQLKAKMTTEEQNAQAQIDREEHMKSIEKENFVLKQTALMLGKGFTNDEAEKIATARYDGDLDTAFSLENAHYDALRQKDEADYKAKLAAVTTPAQGQGQVNYAKQFEDAMKNGDSISAVAAKLKESGFIQ